MGWVQTAGVISSARRAPNEAMSLLVTSLGDVVGSTGEAFGLSSALVIFSEGSARFAESASGMSMSVMLFEGRFMCSSMKKGGVSGK